MKAAKTWRLAGVFLLAGIATVSCGKDEGTGGQGGSGVIGGSGGGGTGGTAGRGGSGGGRPDGGSANSGTTLGKACINDGQCADTKTPGLKCVTSKDAVLGEGAPPKGLCTAECAGDDDCSAFGDNSLCFPFDSSGTGYCVETCGFGDPGLGTKCHDRPEFACNPTLARTDTPCTDDSDCGNGDLCLDSGTCAVVIPACLPSCRGDIDCEDGMYCDQSFLSGVCVSKKPTGKALGEPCTVRDEPDECLGFCQADEANSTKGHCTATCGLGYECGYNSGTGKFDGVCLFASTLTAENGALGDFGFCTNTCNCTDECNDSGLKCQLLDQGALTTDFKGAGLCFGEDPNGQTKEYNQCSGAGGSGNGGAGGEPGAGGAGGAGGEPPASGGGEPAVGGGGAGG